MTIGVSPSYLTCRCNGCCEEMKSWWGSKESTTNLNQLIEQHEVEAGVRKRKRHKCNESLAFSVHIYYASGDFVSSMRQVATVWTFQSNLTTSPGLYCDFRSPSNIAYVAVEVRMRTWDRFFEIGFSTYSDITGLRLSLYHALEQKTLLRQSYRA